MWKKAHPVLPVMMAAVQDTEVWGNDPNFSQQ